jgi:hypothetical protein
MQGRVIWGGLPAQKMGYVDGTGDGVKRPSILAGSMSGKEELDWDLEREKAERGISLRLRLRGRVSGGDLD